MATKIKGKFRLSPKNWIIGDSFLEENFQKEIYRILSEHFNLLLDKFVDGEFFISVEPPKMDLHVTFGGDLKSDPTLIIPLMDVFDFFCEPGWFEKDIYFKCAKKLRKIANLVEAAGNDEDWNKEC